MLIGILLLPPSAISAANMNLYGTLVEHQPCIVNNALPIDVPFGEVLIEQINGINYEKKIKLVFECETPEIPPLSLRHKGTVTNFDEAAVSGIVHDFGIHVDLETANGRVPFTVGKAFIITDRAQSSLQTTIMVTPVKKKGAILGAGYFTATSTLQIEYQ